MKIKFFCGRRIHEDERDQQAHPALLIAGDHDDNDFAAAGDVHITIGHT